MKTNGKGWTVVVKRFGRFVSYVNVPDRETAALNCAVARKQGYYGATVMPETELYAKYGPLSNGAAVPAKAHRRAG